MTATMCGPTLTVDRESVEDILIDVAIPAGVEPADLTWQVAMVSDTAATRAWRGAITTTYGCRFTLTGATDPGVYTVFVRGPSGTPTLEVPGSILVT